MLPVHATSYQFLWQQIPSVHSFLNNLSNQICKLLKHRQQVLSYKNLDDVIDSFAYSSSNLLFNENLLKNIDINDFSPIKCVQRINSSSESLYLHSSYLHHNLIGYKQRRYFRTEHSGTSGIFARRNAKESSLKKIFTKENMLEFSGLKAKQQPEENNFLKNLENATDEEKRKLKIAFAEGYLSNSPQQVSQKSTWKSIRQIMFYGLLLWLIVNTFSIVGGVRNNISNVIIPSKFEVAPEDISVTFDDVKGVDEAKQELLDIVSFLRSPSKYTRLGARLPKGVLLVGPPGTGKTLLARAVAGEADVPFFHASGSEFDEMFVGTGARRVRQLFSAAKLRSPCVIFIDEIDSVGAKRTNSQLHPYANQTINQLLAEMDGFERNEGIIVLAATNRKSHLDQAILRPGRFDVEVNVSLPDAKGRKEILDLYLSKVMHDKYIDTMKLALGTTGFTGADLENVVNQASLRAAQLNYRYVSNEHLEWARDKVLMGPERLSRIPDADTNKVTAYHEAGHTIVSYFTKHSNPLHKVTIIPRGDALGYTASLPEKDMYNKTKLQLLAELDLCMGGRAAEELIFGSDMVTTGASSDFMQATQIATAMVKKLGMSEKVGQRVFRDEETDVGLATVSWNEVSPSMQDVIDQEIKRILSESYERAKNVLKNHMVELKSLAAALLELETLDSDAIKRIIDLKE